MGNATSNSFLYLLSMWKDALQPGYWNKVFVDKLNMASSLSFESATVSYGNPVFLAEHKASHCTFGPATARERKSSVFGQTQGITMRLFCYGNQEHKYKQKSNDSRALGPGKSGKGSWRLEQYKWSESELPKNKPVVLVSVGRSFSIFCGLWHTLAPPTHQFLDQSDIRCYSYWP